MCFKNCFFYKKNKENKENTLRTCLFYVCENCFPRKQEKHDWFLVFLSLIKIKKTHKKSKKTK